MLVFYTRLPLADTVSRIDCIKLITNWICESPKFPISHIPLDPNHAGDFHYRKGKTSFFLGDKGCDALDCRIEKKSSRITWCTAFLMDQQDGQRYMDISVTQDQSRDGSHFCRIIKPSVIRQLLGCCRDDQGIPISDTSLDADHTYYPLCVNLLNASLPCRMPTVLVSCDAQGNHAVNDQYLSAQLGGIAHVLVQKDPHTTQKLNADAPDCVIRPGEIGVRYHNAAPIHIYSPEQFSNGRDMNWAIIHDIRNHLVQEHNWQA